MDHVLVFFQFSDLFLFFFRETAVDLSFLIFDLWATVLISLWIIDWLSWSSIYVWRYFCIDWSLILGIFVGFQT
jgi:hypothetical protein